MTTTPTLHIRLESGPVLFADCPFCLRPLPFDMVTGSMDCEDCGIHLEVASQPGRKPAALAPAA